MVEKAAALINYFDRIAATVREIDPPSRERYGATSRTRVKIGPIGGEAERFLNSARRRTPTSGDASRAIRGRLAGPNCPDDERCRDS
jgi:hypothetical protein